MSKVCPCCGQSVPNAAEKALSDLVLPRQQRRIVDALLSRFDRIVTTEQILDWVHADDPSGGPLKAERSLKVQIYHVRRRLAVTDLEIINIPSIGYRMRWRRQSLAA